ncbi:MAG: DUF3644 domain-containing protein [Candidatus Heimdallarchaeaceae archaeon]
MKRLTKQLIKKSKQAFLLGLEIYNKPTIEYRLESFSFFFINAWELLLKARILERTKKEKEIFYKKERGKDRRSLSLADALKKVFPQDKDPVRMNIEEIQKLRDSATHLIIPELERVYVGLFQAGVLNYVEKIREWFNIDIIKETSPAMLSLIFDIHEIDPVVIKRKHGTEAKDFLQKRLADISKKQELIKNRQYSVSVEYKLALVKDPKKADIVLSPGSNAIEKGYIIEVPKDPSRTHPYRQKECIEEVKKRIDKNIVFNQYDFQCILFREKIRSKPQYYYFFKTTKAHAYSKDLVDFIVNKIQNNPNYLLKTRAYYKERRNKK